MNNSKSFKKIAMKKYFFLFITLIITQLTHSQAEFKVDYDQIKTEISNPESKYYYPKLLERFNNFDSNLSHKEYCYLYYGFPYHKNYLVNQPSEKELNDLIFNDKYEEALAFCEKILAVNPVSLKANDMMAYSIFKLARPKKEYEKYVKRYRGLINAITWSGDGFCCESAYKVIYPSDKFYVLYNHFEVQKVLGNKDLENCHEFKIERIKTFNAEFMYFDLCRKNLVTQ